MAVIFSTAQPQSGLATSTRCWSGFMKQREEQHVNESSPRGSPRTWEVVSDIPNLLARLSPGWHRVKVGVPRSASKVLPLCVSAAAVLMGSQFWQHCFLDWVCDVVPSAFRDEGIKPQPARPRSSHPVSCSSSPFFSSRPGSGCDISVAWLSDSLTRHAQRDVADSSLVAKYLDSSVPESWRSSPSHVAGGQLRSLQLGSRFEYAEQFCVSFGCFSCSAGSKQQRAGEPVVAACFSPDSLHFTPRRRSGVCSDFTTALVEDEEATWRKNYSSVEPWIERVLEVLEDQFSRGQVLKLTETEAGGRFPDSVVASLGAIRKDPGFV